MAMNFAETVNKISPQDMELLIRAYVRRHIHPLKEGYAGNVSFVLSGTVSHKSTDESKAIWRVAAEYGTCDSAKGEVLATVAAEFYRRVGWSESSAASLLMIEGAVVEAPPTDASF